MSFETVHIGEHVLYRGDCVEVLGGLESDSVHCCVTSPPYWGLRDYGTERWEGGDVGCDHKHDTRHQAQGATSQRAGRSNTEAQRNENFCDICGKCGARRVDDQLGLESTLELYVEHLVAVFREVRRVLRDDGTLWCNLGDGYSSGGRNTWRSGASDNKGHQVLDDASYRPDTPPGLKPKDLVGIPWRVAFALQADGWWLRQDIIWCLSGGAWLYARTQKGTAPAMLKDLARLDPATVELWTGECWTSVVAWTKRDGRADAQEIVLRSGERIGCTGGHLWPTQRGNVRAGELRGGDRIKAARLPGGGKAGEWLTRDAFWFAGLYLAEGSRSGGTIQLAGHVCETARWRRIQSLASHYGATARLYERGKTQTIQIDRAAALNAILGALIGGRTAKDKHLTNTAWGYRNSALKLIAEGYLEGDGHDDGDRIRLGFTRNYALERDLRCLAARLDATITLKPTFAKNKQGRFPSFRGEWRWKRTGHHNERDRGEVIEVRRSRARQFWDVTVADSSSLFALSSGVLSHNSKPNPMPESVTDRCTKAHEYLFLLSKSAKYHYDADAIREPQISGYPSSETLRGQSWNKHDADKTRGSAPSTKIRDGRDASHVSHPLGRNRRSVWTIPTQNYPEAHFATYPEKLVEPCILAGCPEGGVVLDPFLGSGTTLVVAAKHGCKGVGIELNAEYLELSTKRIRCEVEQLKMQFVMAVDLDL